MLRDKLVDIALQWQAIFGVAPSITSSISADKIIKNKFQRGSILGKIAFGMLAIVIICASIFISSWASELYITKWNMLG